MYVRKRYELNKSDWADFQYYSAGKRSVYCIISLIIMLVIIAVCIIMKEDVSFIKSRLDNIITFAILPIIYFISAYRKGKKDYKENYCEGEIFEVIFDYRGFTQGPVDEMVTVLFEQIESVSESNSGLYVAVNDTAIIIPKRCFNEDELSAIKELLRSNMPKKKLKLKRG